MSRAPIEKQCSSVHSPADSGVDAPGQLQRLPPALGAGVRAVMGRPKKDRASSALSARGAAECRPRCAKAIKSASGLLGERRRSNDRRDRRCVPLLGLRGKAPRPPTHPKHFRPRGLHSWELRPLHWRNSELPKAARNLAIAEVKKCYKNRGGPFSFQFVEGTYCLEMKAAPY